MKASYIPLYRKYRPQKFSDLVGQDAIVKTLSNAIKLNKVAHAYLFTGPRGTGKTSAARILAKSLNCENGATVDPCGVCSSCLGVASGSSIDVIEIDAASNRKVEDARNLLDKVQFVPVSGRYKVYIIDEVHMLTTEAFNTLLKTLEEPPQNLVFILATTEIHKVLNTIISRCQRFDFRRIRQDLLVERLAEIVKLENINISANAVNLIARRSSGGLRDAISLLDQVSILSSTGKEVSENDILTLVGCLNDDTLIKLSDSIASKDTGTLLSLLDNIIQLGNEPLQIARELMNHFRNLVFLKSVEKIDDISHIIDISKEYLPDLKAQSERFEVIEIVQIIDKLSECERTLKTTTKQVLHLETALIGIANRFDINIISELEERILKLELALSGNMPISPKPAAEIKKPEPIIKPVEASRQIEQKDTVITPKVSQKPAETRQAEQVSSQSSAEVNGEENIEVAWKQLLENIESIPSRMFFSSLATPAEINKKTVVAVFKNESFAKQAQDKSKMTPFESAALKYFGELPKIIMRTALPDDKPVAAQTPAPVKPAPKVNYEQISQELEETNKNIKPSVVVDESPSEPVDEEVTEEMNRLEAPAIAEDLPDSARMVLELFNGKLIN